MESRDRIPAAAGTAAAVDAVPPGERAHQPRRRALELNDLTGLDIFDLVAFRPERLALHELLIRVTADLSVPSGSRVEDLGINFREMVNTLLANHVAAQDARGGRDLRQRCAGRLASIDRSPNSRRESSEPATASPGGASTDGARMASAHAASGASRFPDPGTRPTAAADPRSRDRRVANRGAGRDPARTGCASPRAARWPGSSVRSWAGTATCGARGN